MIHSGGTVRFVSFPAVKKQAIPMPLVRQQMFECPCNMDSMQPPYKIDSVYPGSTDSVQLCNMDSVYSCNVDSV